MIAVTLALYLMAPPMGMNTKSASITGFCVVENVRMTRPTSSSKEEMSSEDRNEIKSMIMPASTPKMADNMPKLPYNHPASESENPNSADKCAGRTSAALK